MKLWLDDVRPKPDASWFLVQNFSSFVRTVVDNGVPEVVSFDHDLALEHYQMLSDPEMTSDTPTGLDCAKFLYSYCQCLNIWPEQVIVHSWNPDGAKRIGEIFKGRCPVRLLAYGVPEHCAVTL